MDGGAVMSNVRRVLVEKDIPIPLRDGVVTYADVYRPLDGPPAPTVLVRTPYDKEVATALVGVVPGWVKLAERGYAVVVQDVRGRFSSEGVFYPFANEGADGVDTVEWVRSQPWCNGRAGILGASYYGATTLLAAREAPEGLRCIIPIITADDYHAGWAYQGGAFELGFMGTWGAGLAAMQFLRPDCPVSPEARRRLQGALADPRAMLTHMPIAEMPGMSEPDVAPYWADWTAHRTDSDYWRQWRIADAHATMRPAAFHIGGWFDIFLAGTLRNYQGLAAAGNTAQKLLIGPWAHTNYDRYLGALEFGPTGAAAFAGVIADINTWLDRHLRGDDSVDTGPAVRYFVMGANEWRTDDRWPPSGSRVERWFLHSGGSANSLRGDGVLSQEPPTDEPADTYLYDPSRPVPTGGGNLLMLSIRQPGPWDQREIEQRDDVLVYTSAPLAEPLTVAGPVRVRLHAATDGSDTDWTAKLVDVHPDGRAINLCDGICRARYRDSRQTPALLAPGEVYAYDIDLVATANEFPAGHRLRVEISSSNFPRFDRNTNTGGEIATEQHGRVAVQRVFHSGRYPSCLELTVLPSGR
jgi:putative CocE/NonD family hydrolase